MARILRSRHQRLVTVTGPGGVGKTRVALAAASEVEADFPDGTHWISLASVRPPADVIALMLEAVGSPQALEMLRGSPLVVLDNAEHLLEGVSHLAAELLRIGGPKLLVTSRERLGVAGERVYPLDGLEEREAVTLFTARVRDLRPRAQIGAGAAKLCSLLDRLPLALELAAAQSSVYTTSELLERVSARLDLAHADRYADERQRTLRATIAWSYDLLAPGEQLAFRRLSPFAGGFTLEAASAIGVSSAVVTALMEKSLLRRVWNSPAIRLLMLEAIRDFAVEQALGTGEDVLAARAHAEYFATITDRIWAGTLRPAPADLDAEVPNLRAALDWARDHREAELVIRLISGIRHVWDRGRVPEIRQSLEDSLPATRDPILRARGRLDLAWELFRSDEHRAARASALKAHATAVRGEHRRLLAEAENMLGTLAAAAGDVESAYRRCGLALQHYREAGHQLGEANTRANLGDIALIAGDLPRSVEFSRGAIALYELLGEATVSITARLNLAAALIGMENREEAEALLRQALTEILQLADGYGAPWALQLVADICHRRGDEASAVRLLRAVDWLMETLGAAHEPSSRQHHDDLLRRLKNQVSHGEGTRPDFTSAIEFALQRLA